tara:strand:+ start:366 stop:560 length:195 start_codon:yes stop_codon:yes gene_type:complete
MTIKKICPICNKAMIEPKQYANATVYHGECLDAAINAMVLQRRFKATLNPSGFSMDRGGKYFPK